MESELAKLEAWSNVLDNALLVPTVLMTVQDLIEFWVFQDAVLSDL